MRKLALLFIFLIAALNVQAIGVSTPYLENNILLLPQGTSTLFSITLQNTGTEDIAVKVDYASDNNIASMTNNQTFYNLKAGSVDNQITFNITAPKNARAGSIYELKYSVSPIKADAGGTISFVPGISRSIKIQITKPAETSFLQGLLDQGLLLGILIIAVVASLILYLAKGKKRRRK
jgi:hypothetical protein